jgi:hypothetical protein
VDERADGQGQSAFRRWLDGLPTAVRWLLGAVLVVAYYGLALVVLNWAVDGPVDWSSPMPGLLGGFGGAFGGLWLQRRRVGGRQRLREYTRALKSGRLPPDADPSEWRSLLAREDRGRRRAAILSYAILGLAAVLWVVLTVRRAGWQGWAGWAFPAVFVAFAGLLAWAGRRHQRRLERLVAQLPEDPVSTA